LPALGLGSVGELGEFAVAWAGEAGKGGDETGRLEPALLLHLATQHASLRRVLGCVPGEGRTPIHREWFTTSSSFKSVRPISW
jgi:hypothetical protein